MMNHHEEKQSKRNRSTYMNKLQLFLIFYIGEDCCRCSKGNPGTFLRDIDVLGPVFLLFCLDFNCVQLHFESDMFWLFHHRPIHNSTGASVS